jgi:hypothetical protein
MSMRYAPSGRRSNAASRVPASLSLEIVTSLSEQQKAVRTDGMVYNELTDVDATPTRAAARLNRQLLRRELQSVHGRRFLTAPNGADCRPLVGVLEP